MGEMGHRPSRTSGTWFDVDGTPTMGFDCTASWNKSVFLLVGAFDKLFPFLRSVAGTLVFLNVGYINMNTMETHLVLWREGNLYE